MQTDTQAGSQTDESSDTNQFVWTGCSVVACPQTGSTDAGSGSSTSTGTDTTTTTTSTYSGTAWILDSVNATSGYLDVISGSDQAYSDPLVLTAASNGGLGLSSLSAIGGVVTSTQTWAFEYESTSSATIKKDGGQAHMMSDSGRRLRRIMTLKRRPGRWACFCQ